MTRADLKARVCQTIDAHAQQLEQLARQIFAQPELGFKEHHTASVVHDWFDRLGLPHQDGIALTGSRADMDGGSDGPTVAILGELDSLLCWEHPERDVRTGAVHACGHNAQIAMMLGAGLGLREVAPELAGRVALMAVPAEEYVELEDGDIAVGGTNNGMVAKFVRFLGRTSHSGGAPDQGINALSAARVALAGIDAIRETFRDDDHIRVHPIVTRGGDVVNAIPADVRLEMFCRGATVEAIELAHRKVDRALKAGALALGGSVEITTLPGYLPLYHDPSLVSLFRANAIDLIGAANVREKGHGGGSTDMGDISHILPTVHPYAGGASGAGHGADYRIDDYSRAVITPAKAMAMTVIDLLTDDAAEAKRIVAAFKPRMTRQDYLAYLRRLSTKQLYRAEDLE